MEEQEKYIALAQLTIQLQQKPLDAALLLQRAKVYLSLGDKAKALDDLDAAISADATRAEAFMLRGQLRFELHDKNAAFEDLQRAMQLDPDILNNVSGEYKTPQAPKAFVIPK